MSKTKGLEALRGQMSALGLSQSRVGDLVGVSQPSVSAWLSGIARPDSAQRDILALVLQIPREWWRTDEEQARIDRFANPDEAA